MVRHGRSHAWRMVPALTATTALLTGCGGDQAGADSDGTTVGGTVTVFAAASLTEPFTQIAADFEDANPGTSVTLSPAGSSTLAQQITEGAPADVFASANPVTMQTVTDAGLTVAEPPILVRNSLVIAVEAGNPRGVTGLADLATPDLAVAFCAEQVPCGSAAQAALDSAGVDVQPDTLERDVKAAIAKVNLGEVDAALVYRTDVRAAPDVDGVEFPESASAVNDYPISVLADAPNPATAEAFVAYVRSDPGMTVLTDAGFQEP